MINWTQESTLEYRNSILQELWNLEDEIDNYYLNLFYWD